MGYTHDLFKRRDLGAGWMAALHPTHAHSHTVSHQSFFLSGAAEQTVWHQSPPTGLTDSEKEDGTHLTIAVRARRPHRALRIHEQRVIPPTRRMDEARLLCSAEILRGQFEWGILRDIVDVGEAEGA